MNVQWEDENLGESICNALKKEEVTYADIEGITGISIDSQYVVKLDWKDKTEQYVYNSGNPERQIVLYEYQKTRNASHPRNFLKDYTGICVTDGYQVYHTLEKEREDLRIAGCWVHCRRRFYDALEVIPKAHQKESILHLFIKQIQAIYREEGKLAGLSSEERLAQRQLVVKPLVDAFFAYLK